MPAALLGDDDGPQERAILIIDQDQDAVDAVRSALRLQGYRVVSAASAEQGVEAFRRESPVLVLLELCLPRLSGLEVCRIIRAESEVRVIIVGNGGEADTVAAFELGADDCVTKPLSMAELSARIRAQLRRAGPPRARPEAEVLCCGPVELDPERHEVRVRGRPVELPLKEFELLAVLLQGRGRLRTRHFLISEVWGPNYYGDTKTLDVHVKRLRRRIETDPRNPEHIITVRGLGYRFLDEPASADQSDEQGPDRRRGYGVLSVGA